MNAKLGIWSAYYIDLSPEEAVDEIAKAGFKYSELSDEHGQILLERGKDEVATGKAFKAYADSKGVKFPQGHLWLGIHLCNDDPTTIPTLKRWINLFEAIGIKNMVLHMDHMLDSGLSKKEVLTKNAETLKQLVPFLKGKKVKICLENLIAGSQTVEDLLFVIKKLKSSNFAITLDTGHLNIVDENLYSRDQEHFIMTANKKLKALHIADNEGKLFDDQHLMPFGKGNVDFKKVISCLRKINYSGLLNYEIPGERNAPLEIRRYKLQYIKKTFKYMMENF